VITEIVVMMFFDPELLTLTEVIHGGGGGWSAVEIFAYILLTFNMKKRVPLSSSIVRPIRQFMRTADILSQQRLRSSTTDSLSVPAVRLFTVGRRAFPVAGVYGSIYLHTLPLHRLRLGLHLSNE